MADWAPAPRDPLLPSDCEREGCTTHANLDEALQAGQVLAHAGITARIVQGCRCGLVHIYERDADRASRRLGKARR